MKGKAEGESVVVGDEVAGDDFDSAEEAELLENLVTKPFVRPGFAEEDGDVMRPPTFSVGQLAERARQAAARAAADIVNNTVCPQQPAVPVKAAPAAAFPSEPSKASPSSAACKLT